MPWSLLPYKQIGNVFVRSVQTKERILDVYIILIKSMAAETKLNGVFASSKGQPDQTIIPASRNGLVDEKLPVLNNLRGSLYSMMTAKAVVMKSVHLRFICGTVTLPGRWTVKEERGQHHGNSVGPRPTRKFSALVSIHSAMVTYHCCSY